MLFKKAVGVGLLAVAGLALAQQELQPGASTRTTIEGGSAASSSPASSSRSKLGPAPQVDWMSLGELKPRRMLAKVPTAQLADKMPLVPSGRLIVKFVDQARARVLPDSVLLSRTAGNMAPVGEILDRFGASIAPVFQKTEQMLVDLEFRAASNSGYAQPDLAGFTYVTVPGGAGVELAAALNDLEIVEFVEFEPVYTTSQGATGACCLSNGLCLDDASLDQCTNASGFYQGDGTTCGGGCGGCCLIDGSGGCLSNLSFDVCTDFPGVPQAAGSACGDGSFDCADIGEPACGEQSASGCFAANPTPFCDNEDCCNMVCAFDPFCCDEDILWPGRGGGVWDEWCSDHALEICAGVFNGGARPLDPIYDPNAPTPNFTDAQGYLTANGYSVDAFGMPPANIARGLRYTSDSDPSGIPPSVQILDGYSGEGYDLQGLWSIGEVLANDAGLGPNGTRGLGIKIGIIEHSAFVSTAVGPDAPYGHEELAGKVIPEPGQTVLVIPQLPEIDGNHGTATLCIAGAIDNDSAGTPRTPGQTSPAASLADQRGIVGVAPDAELYFFPIVSAQAPAGRTLDAIASACAAFDPGDVLSFSIGPGGCGTLASGQGAWTALRLAADLGITCCIAAGNDCCDLATEPQAGSPGGEQLDCDAVIVGAVYPGCDGAAPNPGGLFGLYRYAPSFDPSDITDFNCYCRSPFSNFCDNCDTASDVHISAWGESVATGGYSAPPGFGLFTGNVNGFPHPNRSYTNGFSGTSASTPQVAGLVACLQGLARQFFGDGTVLAPNQIRDVISGNLTGATGNFGQCGFLSEDSVPGNATVASNPCPTPTALHSNSDWDLDANRNSVGTANVVYTNTLAAAEDLLTTGWFDNNPYLDGVEVLEGEYLAGTALSLQAVDGNNFIIGSTRSTPSGPGVVNRGNIASGKVTDLLIHAHSDSPANSTMDVLVASSVTGGDGILLVYMYDWNFQLWLVAGVTFLFGDDVVGPVIAFPVANADRFVKPNTNEVDLRLWTISMGISPDYQVFHDYVSLNITGNPFIPGGSGGP